MVPEKQPHAFARKWTLSSRQTSLCLCVGMAILVVNVMAYNIALLLVLQMVPRSLSDVGDVVHAQARQLLPRSLMRHTKSPIRFVHELFEHYLPPQALDAVHRAYHVFVREAMERVVVTDAVSGRLLRVQWDTSSGHEFRFVMQRIACTASPPMPARPLVVDFGAMDGISGSNSYPFLAAGWDGVLVEAFPDHYSKLLRNIQGLVGRGQQIHAVQAAIADQDGSAMLQIFEDNSKTSNSLSAADNTKPGDRPVSQVEVRTLTVRSLLRQADVQCDSSASMASDLMVLTIDIEGQTIKALADVMAAGCRPRYVIVERDLTDEDADARILRPYGYQQIARLLLNHIWEAAGVEIAAECIK